tara:strand:+ start:5611 stop:7773 length:2163 start_codon:yes stop_codon:yes gene_type:complete
MSLITKTLLKQKIGSDPTEFIEDYFCMKTYTGNGSGQVISTHNGDSHYVNLNTNKGFVWIKSKNASRDHILVNTVRGDDYVLHTNQTAGDDYLTNVITAFGSQGITLGNHADVNTNNEVYDMWVFRCKPRFCDIVTWTGNSNSSQNILHGLQTEPAMIWAKSLSTADWEIYHKDAPLLAGTSGTQRAGRLNLHFSNVKYGIGQQEDVFGGNDEADQPTYTYFKASGTLNTNSQTYIAFLFSDDDSQHGFIRTGYYIGGAPNTVNKTIDCGWKPQFLMVKNANEDGGEDDANSGDWYVFDDNRGFNQPYISIGGTIESGTNGSNGCGSRYTLNRDAGERTDRVTFSTFPDSIRGVDYNLSSYHANQTHQNFLMNNSYYIYMAIRDKAMAAPTAATQVYKGVAGDGGTSNPRATAGFPPDIAILALGSSPYKTTWTDRTIKFPRDTGGTTRSVATNHDFYDTGFYSSTFPSGDNTTCHMWRKFPKIIDSGFYVGRAADQEVSHNLGVEPEFLMVEKYYNTGTNIVYCKHLRDTTGAGGNNPEDYYLGMWHDYLENSYYDNWDVKPDRNVFTITQQSGANFNVLFDIYTYYVAASYPGICKVGSYAGSPNDQTIDCGFSSGARNVLIRCAENTSPSSGGGHRGTWMMFDTLTGIGASTDPFRVLGGSTSVALQTGTDIVAADNSGFVVKGGAIISSEQSGGQVRSNDANDGQTDSRYIFIAWA